MKIRKIASVFIANIMLFSISSYYNKATASGYPLLMLRPNGVKTYEAKAGEVIQLQYNVSGTDGWCSSGIHLKYDNRLDIQLDSDNKISFTKGNAVADLSCFEVREVDLAFFNYNIEGLGDNENGLFVSTGDENNDGSDGTIAVFYFKVPDDAKAGDSYNFDFFRMQNDMFTDRDRNQEMQDYVFSNWDGGVIEIPEVTTTSTTTTTTTKKTTTTSTTTTSKATTTTSTTTTTTKKTTTTSTTTTTPKATTTTSTTTTTTSKATTSATSTTTTTTTTAAINYIKGDANNDGFVDVADVVALSAYVGDSEANKLDEKSVKNADVHNTGDGITANDALMVQQYIAKIIDTL